MDFERLDTFYCKRKQGCYHLCEILFEVSESVDIYGQKHSNS